MTGNLTSSQNQNSMENNESDQKLYFVVDLGEDRQFVTIGIKNKEIADMHLKKYGTVMVRAESKEEARRIVENNSSNWPVITEKMKEDHWYSQVAPTWRGKYDRSMFIRLFNIKPLSWSTTSCSANDQGSELVWFPHYSGIRRVKGVDLKSRLVLEKEVVTGHYSFTLAVDGLKEGEIYALCKKNSAGQYKAHQFIIPFHLNSDGGNKVLLYKETSVKHEIVNLFPLTDEQAAIASINLELEQRRRTYQVSNLLESWRHEGFAENLLKERTNKVLQSSEYFDGTWFEEYKDLNYDIEEDEFLKKARDDLIERSKKKIKGRRQKKGSQKTDSSN